MSADMRELVGVHPGTVLVQRAADVLQIWREVVLFVAHYRLIRTSVPLSDIG